MLGKLYKNEMKIMTKRFAPMLLVFVASVLLNRVLLSYSMKRNRLPAVLEMFIAFFQLAFWLFVIAFTVLTVVLCVQRYYNHLFGDEGYLTMTLPVEPWQHVLVKGTVAGLWSIINAIVVIIGSLLSIPQKGLLGGVFRQIGYGISEAARLINMPIILFVLEIIILIALIVSTIYFIMYCAVTVGQNFKKHRIIGAFVSYFAINMIVQIVYTFLFVKTIERYNYTEVMGNEFAFINRVVILSTIIYAVFGVISFWVSSYHLKNRLDLE